MILATLVSSIFAVVLFAQADPRIVRTTVPAECKSPVSIGASGRNYPNGLRQFQEVLVDCIASHTDDSVTHAFGTATFCGSNDSGTEQSFMR